MNKTMYEKIWESHVVHQEEGAAGDPVRRPASHPRGDDPAGIRRSARGGQGSSTHRPYGCRRRPQHATDPGRVTLPFRDPIAKQQLDALKSNCEEFGINLFDMASPNQGIVHIIGRSRDGHSPAR